MVGPRCAMAGGASATANTTRSRGTGCCNGRMDCASSFSFRRGYQVPYPKLNSVLLPGYCCSTVTDFLLFIGAVKLTVSERSNDDVTQTDNDMKTFLHHDVIKTFIWTYDVILHTSNNYSLWSVLITDYSLDYFNYTETFQRVLDLCLTLKEFVNMFHRPFYVEITLLFEQSVSLHSSLFHRFLY